MLAILIGLAAVLTWFSSALLTGWLLIGVVLALMPCLPVVCNFLNSPMEKAVNQHFVNDALSRLRQMPDMKIIGITGSYGKTSVKFYLKTLLEARYSVLMTPESFNTPMGVVRTIREHLRPDHEIFLCEMGARHVGDIKEICDMVHPDWGVITSIGPQHLETFFTMENIVHTKFELADALPDHGTLFLNGDCSYITVTAIPTGFSIRPRSSGRADTMRRISASASWGRILPWFPPRGRRTATRPGSSAATT